MDWRHTVGLRDNTKDPSEVHGFDLKVRQFGVVVFLSPIQLHRSDVEWAGHWI